MMTMGMVVMMMTMGMVVMVIFLRIHMLNPTDSGPIVTHCR